ncbi:uncharacterized protein LOC131880171 isoform X2 [Tigriopus californicus]|uniref:uncharacterized protein LOC131880171 isoform X2 n=1 Tax=Tigriopus californicus TaxID=6832 RepID=UPI0027DA0485|nr:uncharacterized protein LOC131880171 isoform X2 [Tigriopus californicus]
MGCEPMNVALGGQGYFHNSEIKKRFMRLVSQNASVMATDVATGQLVGTRIAGVKEKENNGLTEPSLKMLQSKNSEKLAIILFTFAKYIKDWDHFHDFQNLDRVYYMYSLTTHPNWGGRGLAQQLLAQSLKVAKKVVAMELRLWPQMMRQSTFFRKMGMTVLSEVPWSEIESGWQKAICQCEIKSSNQFLSQI